MTQKTLIIIGSAPCVGSDLAAAALLLPTPLPRNTNDASRFTSDEICFMLIGLDAVDKYPGRVEYFATYHPQDIIPAINRRKTIGNTDWKIISHVQHDDGLVSIILPLEGKSGSSALLGVLVGIREGYEKIIVCGCPLIGKNDKGGSYEVFRKGWEANINAIKDKVRSMSGWTMELVGAPTIEWLSAVIPAEAGIQED